MSDHLPECRYVVFQQQGQIPEAVIPMRCICAALRACEQRVLSGPMSMPSYLDGRKRGYAAGLDAAREAVEQVSTLFEPLGPALAAIDALRGES